MRCMSFAKLFLNGSWISKLNSTVEMNSGRGID